MRTAIFQLIFITLFLLSSNWAFASSDPKAQFNQRYPNEKIALIKTEDINSDKKTESFILTESGKFYLINSKGIIVFIQDEIYSDEYFEEPNIQIFSPAKNEKHVAVTYNYAPSNTKLYVYKLEYGTLKPKLSIMGDLEVRIEPNGEILEFWKNPLSHADAWGLSLATYKWDAKYGKYRGTGQLP
ncbi:hypothetical protein [Paenibacillus ottowii]